MNIIQRKNKKLYVFLALLSILAVNAFMTNLLYYPNNSNDITSEDSLLDPKKNDISADNNYNGIGAPWNITHWANRTDYDLSANFGNNSYDLVSIPLDDDWTGYNLKSSINNLYDSRN